MNRDPITVEGDDNFVISGSLSLATEPNRPPPGKGRECPYCHEMNWKPHPICWNCHFKLASYDAYQYHSGIIQNCWRYIAVAAIIFFSSIYLGDPLLKKLGFRGLDSWFFVVPLVAGLVAWGNIQVMEKHQRARSQL